MRSEIVKLTVPEYDAIDAVRSSELKTLLLASPKHYRYAIDHESDSTDAMRFGTLSHTATLEPERLGVDFAAFEGRKAGAAWEHFRRMHAGVEIVSAKDMDRAVELATSVRTDPECSPYLKQGRAEVSILWTDAATGLDCKARVDWLDEQASPPRLVGLKTARKSGEEAFSRQAGDLLYHVSWAFYREGYHAVTGVWPDTIEIVVESSPPYDPVVYAIDECTINAGEQLVRQGLERIAQCKASGRWPGQGEGGPKTVTLKPWHMGHVDDALDYTGVEGA